MKKNILDIRHSVGFFAGCRAWRLLSVTVLSAAMLVGILALMAIPKARAANYDLTAHCPGGVGDVGVLVNTIRQANAAPGADTIILAQSCVYTLTAVDNYWYGPNGLPPITSTLVISGNGASIIRATGIYTPFRIFYVSGSPW
jgi:hypothetical protein